MLTSRMNGWLGRSVAVIGLSSMLLLGGCIGGGDSSSSSSSSSTSSDLKGALYASVEVAPVVSHTLLRQDGSKIQNATITYSAEATGVATINRAQIDAAVATTDINGVASVAVPAGSYTRMISNTPAGLVSGENQPVRYAVAISADGSKTLQADQYAVAISADINLDSVTLEIYQTDAAGNTDLGTEAYVAQPMNSTIDIDSKDPLVFTKTVTGIAATATPTSASINAELFEGTYRVVIRATPADATKFIAPYVSSVVTIVGSGTVVNSAVTLQSGLGNALSVTLKDSAGTAITNRDVAFFDRNTQILLGVSTTDATNGVATQLVGTDMTNVVAVVFDAAGNTAEAVYQFSNISSSVNAVTLQEYSVAGKLSPSAGASLKTTAATVQAYHDTGLSLGLDRILVKSVLTSADGLGTYSMNLFGVAGTGLSYKLRAINVTDLPDVTPLSVKVVDAALTSQDISVAPGGVIMGKIELENGTDLANVKVSIIRIEADGTLTFLPTAASHTSDSLGDYKAQVPYGNYSLLVKGAVSEGITVSAASPTFTKNLKQYQLTGRITKNQGGTLLAAAGAKVFAGTDKASYTTDGMGIYTVNLMEGQNYICARPSTTDASFGYICNMNVMVDAATVAAAKQ